MQFRFLRLCILFTLLPAAFLGAQVNSPVIKAVLEQGEALQGVEIYSTSAISTVSAFTDDEPGGGFTAVAGRPGYFKLRYTAPTDFLGKDIAVFECTESLFGPKTYVTVEVQVVSSILSANDDYATIGLGDAEVILNLLQNDYSSEGAIKLVSIELVRGGNVSILSDSTVSFTVNEGFDGLGTFNYIIKDSKGTTSSGVAYINVVGQEVKSIDTLYYTHVTSEDLLLILPSDGFVLSPESNLLFGSLDNDSPFILTYTPTLFTSGIEFFKVVNDEGVERYIEIELIQGADIQNIAVNDIAHTSQGNYVIIDALANDYKSNVAVIDYSSELIYSSGIFSFIPDPGFVGVKQFYYTIHDGQRSYMANIDIYVGNYLPQITSYDFITRKNTPLVLEYNIPITNYSFNLIQEATNGNVGVNQDSFGSIDCSSAEGYQMISYTPSTDFSGKDAFEIEYCVDNGPCRSVNININIVDTDEECICVGPDCVWAGDANHDGVVNVADLLPMGYHYGESGISRVNSGTEWGAEYADDWSLTQDITGENTKYIDANGDGLISAADTVAIISNYNHFDNLVSQSVLIDKNIPVRYEVDNLTPSIGDVVNIEIYLGTEQNPVVDLHGWSTSIQLPSNWVDSTSSLTFIPNTDWIGSNSPLLTLSHSPRLGQLDIAMSRTVDVGISGDGPLGSVQIVGTIDIDGFRPSDVEIPVDLMIPSSSFTDGSGRQYSVEGTTLRLMYQFNDTDDTSIITDEIDVLAFPNPSNGQLTFHANNRDELVEVALYNMVGQQVFIKSNIGSNDLKVSEGLAEGVYFAHITTTKGKDIQKIEVIK